MDGPCQETSFIFNVHMYKELRPIVTLPNSLLPFLKANKDYTVILKQSRSRSINSAGLR